MFDIMDEVYVQAAVLLLGKAGILKENLIVVCYNDRTKEDLFSQSAQ